MAAKKTTTKSAKKPTTQKTAKSPSVKKSTAAKKATTKAAPAKTPEPKQPATKADKPAATKKSTAKSTATPTAATPAANGTQPAKPTKSPHSAGFIKKQHQRLLDLRDELVDAMSGMTRDTIRNAPEGSEASGSGMHQGDAGSDAYDRDFALSVLAKEQDALYEIEQALRRVKDGTYGVCELSGEKIPQPRLEAIPFARLTVQCQAQWEKEYGNRRFRPSNEVGFSGGNSLDDEDSDAVLLDEDDE